jgi:hypothetical protein
MLEIAYQCFLGTWKEVPTTCQQTHQIVNPIFICFGLLVDVSIYSFGAKQSRYVDGISYICVANSFVV